MYSTSTQVSRPILRPGVLRPYPGERLVTVRPRRDVSNDSRSVVATECSGKALHSLEELSRENFDAMSADYLHIEAGVDHNLDTLPPKLHQQVETLASQHVANIKAVHQELIKQQALRGVNIGSMALDASENSNPIPISNSELHAISREKAAQAIRLQREMEDYQAQFWRDISIHTNLSEKPKKMETTEKFMQFSELYAEQYKSVMKSLQKFAASGDFSERCRSPKAAALATASLL